MNRRFALNRISGLLAIAASTGSTSLLAQADKTVSIVVPYAPAGTTDMLGRMLALQLAPLLGRQIVVDNRPGAGSGIGAAYVARALPDGNTLLVATSTTLSINPWLYKKLNYDPAKDFAPIGMIGAVPLLVVVNASLPVKNMEELLALSKLRPAGLSYGSAGNGSPHHLGVEMFKAQTGANLVHVPYKGSALAVTDLLGGQIDVMFTDIPPALAHVKSGRLRALAVTSLKPLSALPNVPTVAASGVAGTRGFEAVAWQCLVAPAGTPKEIISNYSEQLAKVMAQPALREKLERDGFDPGASTPDELAAYIKTETERWGKVIRASGAIIG